MTTPAQLRQWGKASARKYGIDWKVFESQIQHESGWNPAALSPVGAIGLGQLMPGTARGLGVDPHDPQQNLDGAARYLRSQLNRFGSYRLALAAYNAGPGNVEQYKGVPPFKETQRYVKNVLGSAGTITTRPKTVGSRDATLPPVAATATVATSTTYQPPPPADLLTSSAFQALGRIGRGESPTYVLETTTPDPISSTLADARMPPTEIPLPSDPVPTTPVTGRTKFPKPDTSWGGSHAVARSLAEVAFHSGLKSVSEKRSRQQTTTGNVSDHYEGAKDSYAYDLSNGDEPTPEMDSAAVLIARQLGVDYDGRSPLVLTVRQNGYRIQVLYRTQVGGNHDNHLHVGVRKL